MSYEMSGEHDPVTIVLVDDHEMFRVGVRSEMEQHLSLIHI